MGDRNSIYIELSNVPEEYDNFLEDMVKGFIASFYGIPNVVFEVTDEGEISRFNSSEVFNLEQS